MQKGDPGALDGGCQGLLATGPCSEDPAVRGSLWGESPLSPLCPGVGSAFRSLWGGEGGGWLSGVTRPASPVQSQATLT